MERIDISDYELSEIKKCHYCDCATYPICTWIGEPCKECFCANTFAHYEADNRHPGMFSSQTILSPKRLINNPRVIEIKTNPDGDCLYDCFARALNQYLEQSHKKITVSDLRMFVSRRQTQDTYTAYKTLAASSSDYGCISKTHSLRSFKNIVQLCGSNVGSDQCLWGDENTLNFLSESYCIRIVVFNEKGKLIQIIGSPDLQHTLLLRLNRKEASSEHFTLLQFNNQSILQQHEWFWLKKHLHI